MSSPKSPVSNPPPMKTKISLRTLSAAILWLIAASHSTFAAPWTPSDLGDRVWLDWWAEDLPDGPVAAWTSRKGALNALQSTATSQPTKQNGEVYFGVNQKLTFPRQNLAHLAHRAVMVLFRIDLTGTGGGSIFAANGTGGSAERQPLVGYNRDTNKVEARWKTPHGENMLSFAVPENANQWHCLVSRRVGAVHYASLDGKQVDGITPGESQVAMIDWALPVTNIPVTSYIGDFRATGPVMALDTVLLLQEELSLSDAQKLMGWGMWRRGIQTQLPVGHPYRSAAPASTPPTYVFTESTQTEYDALAAFWDNTALSEQYKGTPIDLTGWTLDFEDHFTSHTITNHVTGEGPWYAPTHGDGTGGAVSVVPTDTNPQGTPATYIQSGSEMTLRMQNDGGTWKSGMFCSVNSNGHGRTWMYPYYEVRMKVGVSSTGNTKGPWPAVWLKSKNSFFNQCESYLEYDAYEGYIVDPDGFHNSIHNWPAFRKLPGRLQTHRWMSNYLGLQTSTGGWHENVNLFDGQYHTYGVMVTPTWVINMFDGREMFRFPTPVEMKQPLWTLVSLHMYPNQASLASGIYELTVDYVRVYKNSAYAAVPGDTEMHLMLDESSGTQASDSSPSGRHPGILINGPVWLPTSGKIGGALQFDGANKYVQIPDSDGLDNTNKFTVSLWAYPTLLDGSARTLISKRSNSTTSAYSLFFWTGNRLTVDIDSANNRFSSNTVFQANQWYHIALVYDGSLSSSSRVKLYVNGVLDKTASETSATLPNNAANLLLGQLEINYAYRYSGRLDEVGIYRRALSPGEVAALATEAQ